MAELGIRKFDDLIGRTDLLDMRSGVDHWKAQGLDFARVFHQTAVGCRSAPGTEEQDHGLEARWTPVDRPQPPRAGTRRKVPCHLHRADAQHATARSAPCSVGRGGFKRYGHDGLPDDTIHIQCNGTAGQSFGAFLAHGITMRPGGRRQRLRRQGPVGRAASSCARPTTSAASSPEHHHCRQHRAVWRAQAGECVLQWRGRGTFRGAQLWAPRLSWRARATTAANT